MPLKLHRDLKSGTYLFSLRELGRILNIPETRLEKAIDEGTIKPLGVVGRNQVVAFTTAEIRVLLCAFRKDLRKKNGEAAPAEIETPAPLPELEGPQPTVIPGTFTA